MSDPHLCSLGGLKKEVGTKGQNNSSLFVEDSIIFGGKEAESEISGGLMSVEAVEEEEDLSEDNESFNWLSSKNTDAKVGTEGGNEDDMDESLSGVDDMEGSFTENDDSELISTELSTDIDPDVIKRIHAAAQVEHLLAVAEKEGKRKYGCTLCTFSSDHLRHLRQHLECVHLQLKRFQCDLCDYKAKHKQTIEDHKLKFHYNLQHLSCDRCNYKTHKRSNLAHHIKIVHENIKFKCELCDYTTGRKGSLRQHVNGVHAKLRPLQCDSCDYTAAHKSHLNEHVRNIHLKLKNFQCERCSYKTSIKSNLRMHVNSVHLKKRNFQCEFCDYSAYQQMQVIRHKKRVHKDKLNSSKSSNSGEIERVIVNPPISYHSFDSPPSCNRLSGDVQSSTENTRSADSDTQPHESVGILQHSDNHLEGTRLSNNGNFLSSYTHPISGQPNSHYVTSQDNLAPSGTPSFDTEILYPEASCPPPQI